MASYPELVASTWATVEAMDANDRRIVAGDLHRVLREFMEGPASEIDQCAIVPALYNDLREICQALALMEDSVAPFVPARMHDYQR